MKAVRDHFIVCSFLLFLALTLPVCAQDRNSLTYFEATGQYLKLASEIEKRIGAGAKRTTTLVAPLCLAYGQLKNYSKLFECTANLKKFLAQGDHQVETDSLWVNRGWDALPMATFL